ncbi:lytic transglycosylase domain-containing protein [Sphingosinithalassobacter sp. CS137]|uniref:lytic transglycosylase domain-containing protein n=1 Tax=Sphingosinithalassobacter sp. CS137 TaxID=2762748 RepID=UPI0021CFEF30|nr:lytic transglycosylase domain-containing protein [Sphingosinithalassobacter sp. CS137]
MVAAAASLVAPPASARADPVARWAPYVAEASMRFGVPVAWIERVMRAESGGRTMLAGRPITSHAGAMGLMQLMPGTWAEMRSAHALGADPHDPRDNILAGTAYLRAMYDRFGYPGLFAAYNAGPARYAAYLAGRATLPAETRGYLAAVAKTDAIGAGPASPAPPETLFVVDRTAGRRPNAASPERSDGGLFVPLSGQ